MAANSDLDRTSHELDALRSRALDESAHESNLLQRELHELRNELERCRIERDEWERAVLEERVAVENSRAESANLRRDLELERQSREREADLCEREAERAANLQSVLEDFQASEFLAQSNVAEMRGLHWLQHKIEIFSPSRRHLYRRSIPLSNPSPNSKSER